MLIIQDDGYIKLTRGDTAKFRISASYNDDNAEDYIFQDGDTIRFTIKKSENESEIILQKTLTNGSTLVHIEPNDTKDFKYGKYKYDVELTMANGEVYTIVEPSIFEITKEVTW